VSFCHTAVRSAEILILIVPHSGYHFALGTDLIVDEQMVNRL